MNISLKELRKLKRADLMELLVSQAEEIEHLQNRVLELEDQLNDRNILIAKAGSIAEASLEINKIFEVAQKTADQYLENIHRLAEQQNKNEKNYVE